MTSTGYPEPQYDPPLPPAYGEPAVGPLPPSVAGLQPEPYATLAEQRQRHDPPPEPGYPPPTAPPTAAQPARVRTLTDPGAGNVAGPSADGPITDTAEVLGEADVITLVSGTRVRVRKLKTLELMALMNIVLGGFAGKLNQLSLNPDEPGEVFMAKFGALLITAFPGARQETMAFLREVCDPAGLVPVGARDLGSKAVRDRNEALKAALDDELANADFDDTLSIIEKTMELNAGDFKRWGKRLAGMWRLLAKAGRIPASPTSPA